MKRLILSFALMVVLGYLIGQVVQQKEKTASATLTEAEWSWVLFQIDESPTPGAERKAISKRIVDQIRPQLYPAAKDTTKPKKQ